MIRLENQEIRWEIREIRESFEESGDSGDSVGDSGDSGDSVGDSGDSGDLGDLLNLPNLQQRKLFVRRPYCFYCELNKLFGKQIKSRTNFLNKKS